MSSRLIRYANCDFTIKDFFVNLGTQKQFAVVLLATWVLATYLTIQPFKCIESFSEIADLKEKLNEESIKLETLKQQNGNLFANTKRLGVPNNILKDVASGLGPTPEYENLRRRIYSNTKELWYYLSNQLKEASNEKQQTIKIILKEVADMKRSLLSDQEKLLELDGYEESRRNEAASMSDLVQRRLHHLQNPQDCSNARKLICNLNKSGGFGCQLHHLVYCLILAYATERTLILKSKGWQFNYSGWETVFHPLSETCTSTYDEKVSQWPVPKTVKVVSVPIVEKVSPMPRFLPPVIPQDLAHRIARFNGDASSWWVGQMLKYILKPLDSVQNAIDDTTAKINFKSPVVGVHIRRTDKSTEAVYHNLKEYMVHVEDYYMQLELTTSVDKRRVYLATDDASVLVQARTEYPQYTFYGNLSIAMSAAVDQRTTAQALTGLLVDLYMLSKCDYVVCTFSSNVGRMAYELMQTNRVDASESFFSLDDIYYFCLVFALDRIAVIDNKGGDRDISFEAGDLLGLIPGRHKDGYDRGTNKKTLTSGLIPWYKTAEHLVTYPFPEYKQVSLNIDTNHKN